MRTSNFIIAMVAGSAVLMASPVSCSSDYFPSFDIFHSHCSFDVTFQGQLCATVYQNIVDVINQFNAGGDPSHGTYQYKER